MTTARDRRVQALEAAFVRAIDESGCDGAEALEAMQLVGQRAIATCISGSLVESIDRWLVGLRGKRRIAG